MLHKSTYTHLMSLAAELNAVDAGSNGNQNDIWKNQIPPKADSFVWRVAYICLPSHSRMVQKGLSCSNTQGRTQDSDLPSSIIVQMVKDTLHEWRYMQQQKQWNQQAHQVIRWFKPPPTSLKCNVDCTLFNNNNVTLYGLCFHNHTCYLILDMSNYFHCAIASRS